MKVLLTSILAVVFCTLSMGAVAEQNWPEAIAMPTGFEGEGIKVTPSGDGDVTTRKKSLFLLAIMIGSRWIWRSNLEITKNV